MSHYRLSMEHISKSFPGVKALDDVQFHLEPGSVHALMGENGAGKSTLMKCLFGIYRPDDGTITVDGAQKLNLTPALALRSGISMIHQELNSIPYQTVTENLWVGRYMKKGLVADQRRMEEKTAELLRQFEFDIDPRMQARHLSVSQLQGIEIIKAVSCDSKIIIMDEPTSSLTVTETKHLFKIIRQLQSEGRSIIYISHKLEEVFEIADHITVMRDGRYIHTWPTGEITSDDIIKSMVGRNMNERFPAKSPGTVIGDVILKVTNLTSDNPRSFSNVTFDLHKGEILGIGGLVGAQRTELVESVFGLRKIASGSMALNGAPVAIRTPNDAIKNGFALLTEERRATGIIPMLSILDNAMLASWDDYANAIGVIDERTSGPDTSKVCKSLSVKTPSLQTKIQNLSGGNQQKILLCRWLLRDTSILILDEPTRGIDVGAKFEIYKIMRNLAELGHSIIMVSSEMPELISMSDRILVMCNGKVTGIVSHEDATQEAIMRLATRFN